MLLSKFNASLSVLAVFGFGAVVTATGGRAAGPPAIPLMPVAAAAVVDDADDRTAELKHFAGEWRVIRIETEGKTRPKADLKEARISIRGNRAAVAKVAELADFTFKVDPKRTPVAIDVSFTDGPLKGETVRGIYIRRESTIRMCLRLDNAVLGRPKGYFTSEGSGLITVDLESTAEDVPPAKPPAESPAATGPRNLTVDALASLLLTDGTNPTRAYGHEIEFVGTVCSINTGVDGGTVPVVRIDGWDANRPYGRVFVHNVIPDFVGKVGGRVRVRGMVVGHGYGTLFLWRHDWSRREDG